jgi:23S rRNA (adenine2503-C2)-methyltransferase
MNTAPPSPNPFLPLIHGLSAQDLTGALRDMGAPAYRSAQLWQWLYVHRVSDWEAMTNLPAGFRRELAKRFDLAPVSMLRDECIDESSGTTRKLLVALRDGESIEAVLIPAQGRRTVCISSQVGCRFRCAFCASGQSGFRRNLETGEIVGQVLLACHAYAERVSHVVFMGVGEPFDNYDAVLGAVRILNDSTGLSIGARHITLSTCGVVPGIQRLAAEGLQVELSVSLHAPDDALRGRLMPVNRLHPLEELLAACAEYTRRTRRIITFEYTLIRGVNDAPAQAQTLARRLSAFPCRVNLIPLSPVEEFEGAAPDRAGAETFMRVLNQAGVNATWRDSRGGALKAACGQLRARTLRAS